MHAKNVGVFETATVQLSKNRHSEIHSLPGNPQIREKQIALC